MGWCRSRHLPFLNALESIKAVKHPSHRTPPFGYNADASTFRSFREYGVTSFDSTSPLRQAFKDDKDNYYTRERNFTAIRVPQARRQPKAPSPNSFWRIVPRQNP